MPVATQATLALCVERDPKGHRARRDRGAYEPPDKHRGRVLCSSRRRGLAQQIDLQTPAALGRSDIGRSMHGAAALALGEDEGKLGRRCPATRCGRTRGLRLRRAAARCRRGGRGGLGLRLGGARPWRGCRGGRERGAGGSAGLGHGGRRGGGGGGGGKGGACAAMEPFSDSKIRCPSNTLGHQGRRRAAILPSGALVLRKPREVRCRHRCRHGNRRRCVPTAAIAVGDLRGAREGRRRPGVWIGMA